MKHAPIYFDFDGTLVDTFPGLFDAVNWIRRENGLPPAGEQDVRAWIGGGIDALLRGAVPDADPQMLRGPFLGYYIGDPLLSSRPYDGIEALLDTLRDRPLMIVTNKHADSVGHLLRQLGWRSRFAAVVCPDDAVRKPDPEMVERARRMAGLRTSCGWFVGDSGFDVETGRNAGLRTVAVTWGFRTRAELDAARPDVVVDTPMELLNVLSGAFVP